MRVRSEKKRNEIIDVAGALFLREGYGSVSMATIASAVGGSKGTLYGYFSSKEDLFAAFVIAAGKQRREEFLLLPGKEAALLPTLTALGRNYLRLLLSPEIMAINRLVIAEASRFPELGQIFFENGPKSVIDVIVTLVTDAANRHELILDDPVAAAWRFKALCEVRLFEQCLWAIRDGATEEEIAQNVEPAIRIFLNTYRAGNSKSA
ncbi:TetR/AcrR family transcriptional regulator [Agrobacterium tumefaciens]|uniref:TetR/AcrR family transcriptional regulator n=1 Tax=Agrobacterium TaxID=357 RepID=UPI001294C73E|nr:TetR/AcrR family transcriptional regulator [Agrobacterium sp. ICMP 6402]MQB12272.1 TetR/AcrR family transcriptional regulator [Agrobacterium sp. ICMP 6402]NTA61810.1 TetR/AcrR family transcriptional regulator [Agrobacterium tumefaciens]